MKALTLLDEMSQFHWSMLKSVLLILSMLPVAQGVLSVWQSTEGSSQIMVGFFAISLFQHMGGFELLVCVKSNRTHTRSSTDYSIRTKSGHVLPLYPDAFLAGMVSYLVSQI